MKKVLSVIMATVMAFAFATVSFAAEKPAEAPKAEATKAAKTKVRHVTGEVVSVDAAAKTLTVKGRKGDVVISADDKMLAEVQTGERVTVKYSEKDGKNVAKKIKKAAAKTEKKAAEPAKK